MTRWPSFFRTLAAAATLALAAPAALAADWSHIRIGAEGGHPPFNYVDDMGQLQGFEVDLARAVCERLNASCEFVTQDFANLIPALIAGRFDAIVSSMSITDERRKLIAFSDKYYETPATFVMNKSRPVASTAPDEMRGLKVGAKVGTTNARYLKEVYEPKGVDVRLYQTHDEARLDLMEGRLDALIGDKTALLYWLEKSPRASCCEIVGQDVTDTNYVGFGIGVGLRKTDKDLKGLIDGAIADLRADGGYDAIRKKYFPYDLY